MIEEIVQKHLIPAEDFIYGYADLRGFLRPGLSGFNYGISIGKRLDDNIIDAIKEGPTLEYYYYYKNINRELGHLSKSISSELEEHGIEALAFEPTITEDEKLINAEYQRILTVDLSHKMVATRAGLGWIGKTDLFISEKFGPRLRLVSILFKPKPSGTGSPVQKSKCGNCRICVKKCPAQAANGKLWNFKVHRDEFFDAHKCRAMCRKLASEKFNIDISICGICVSACPKYIRQKPC
jgi:epoxyqueuosine reductase